MGFHDVEDSWFVDPFDDDSMTLIRLVSVIDLNTGTFAYNDIELKDEDWEELVDSVECGERRAAEIINGH